MKISPDSTLVAFGAHGGASPIEILKIEDNKIKKKVIKFLKLLIIF